MLNFELAIKGKVITQRTTYLLYKLEFQIFEKI
jgi:hypothetical protein